MDLSRYFRERCLPWGTKDTAHGASDNSLVIRRGLELREPSRTPLDRSCLLSPARPTVGLFGFFFRPGEEIFHLAASTACSELHDRQARDQPEVPHVDSRHRVAGFQRRCSDQQIAEGDDDSPALLLSLRL